MRDQLTDEMLTQAAKQVAESMKASLPVPKECHHEFPPEFERDMKRLAAQTERRRHMRRYLQRVAAACLAVVISLSTWLAVDAEARAAFVQWVKTVYEQSVVYEFFHSGEAQNEAGYMLGWVPDGYTLENEVGGEIITTLIYLNGEDAIYFTYEQATDGAQTKLFTDDAGTEPVIVNGAEGEFYLSQDSAESNNFTGSTSFNSFKTSTSNVKTLAKTFAENYERPASSEYTERQNNAQKWYNFF